MRVVRLKKPPVKMQTEQLELKLNIKHIMHFFLKILKLCMYDILILKKIVIIKINFEDVTNLTITNLCDLHVFGL